jgi:predicted nucleic acid-binding protein
MRVLLDTDVVLDVVLAREPFVAASAAVWVAHEQQRIEALVSAITPVNTFYIVRRIRGAAVAREAVEHLCQTFRICPIDDAVVHTALALSFADVEDAVQAAAATAAGLDAMVTRNTADYTGAPLPVLTPDELLAQLQNP